MNTVQYYSQSVTPIDSFVEWAIKGANIGLIYSICFKSEVLRVPDKMFYYKSLLNFSFKHTTQTGLVFGTWWFFNKTLEIGFNKDSWINYSLSGVITLNLLKFPLKLSNKTVRTYILPVFIISGLFGVIITRNNKYD